MAKAPAHKKSNVIRVDFSGVETQTFIPEGEYICQVTDAEPAQSEEGKDYIKWTLKVAGGKYAGKLLYNNTTLQKQGLWATKRFLECMGLDIPDGPLDLDLDDVVDMTIGCVVEHSMWKGKTQCKVIDTYPAEAETEGTEEVTEGPTEDEINEMSKTELAALVKEHELDIELTGTTVAQRKQVIAALAEKADEPEETPAPKAKKGKAADEEEETPAPKTRGRPPAKKKKVLVTVDEVNDADEAGLEEMIETHELTVDLEKHATLRRKRAAVIDALEEAELLETDIPF
jgi:uncharacterized protein (DUF305 family)